MWQYLTWAALAAAGAAVGWFASAWVHQRKLEALRVQLKVLRQTLQANADQARRQVGQLQAELASRPPLVRPIDDALVDGFRRKPAAADRFVVLEDGFPQTAVIHDSFPKTMLMR
jgi:hypothetical protein